MSSFLSHRTPSIVVLVFALAAAWSASIARGQCPAPTNVQAESRGCSVRVTWQGNGVVPLVWQVYRNTTSSTAGATSLGNIPPGVFMLDDAPPQRDVAYYYFVRAVPLPFPSGCSAQESAIVSGRLLSLNYWPIAADAGTCGQLTLTWAPFPDAVNYTVYRSLPDGSHVEGFGPFPASTLSYLDPTAGPGDAYGYAVSPGVPCANASQVNLGLAIVPGPPVVAAPTPSVVRSVGGLVVLSYHIDGRNQPTTYQFRRDGQPIQSDGHFAISGTTLTIFNLRTTDTGVYTLQATNFCGTVTEDVVVAVRNPCPADFNESGMKNVQDIFDFLSAWFAPCP